MTLILLFITITIYYFGSRNQSGLPSAEDISQPYLDCSILIKASLIIREFVVVTDIVQHH